MLFSSHGPFSKEPPLQEKNMQTPGIRDIMSHQFMAENIRIYVP